MPRSSACVRTSCARGLRQTRHRPVQLLARGGVTRAHEDLVLAALRVEEREARRIAVHDLTRQVERSAEPGAQPGGADALGADDGVALEHDGLDPGGGRLASGRGSGGTAAHHQKLGALNGAHCRATFAGGPGLTTRTPVTFIKQRRD